MRGVILGGPAMSVLRNFDFGVTEIYRPEGEAHGERRYLVICPWWRVTVYSGFLLNHEKWDFMMRGINLAGDR
jgi:hypothetical protein